MKTMEFCFHCGRVHWVVMTPFPEDGVHCPYDPDNSVMPGCEGKEPRPLFQKPYSVIDLSSDEMTDVHI